VEKDEQLQKIDEIRRRTGVGYAEAKALLDQANGDLLEALVIAEQSKKNHWDKMEVKGWELLAAIKDIIKKGNVSRIVVKRGDTVLLQMPVTAGAIGAILAPNLALIAGIACLATHCTLEIERTGQGDVETASDGGGT